MHMCDRVFFVFVLFVFLKFVSRPSPQKWSLINCIQKCFVVASFQNCVFKSYATNQAADVIFTRIVDTLYDFTMPDGRVHNQLNLKEINKKYIPQHEESIEQQTDVWAGDDGFSNLVKSVSFGSVCAIVCACAEKAQEIIRLITTSFIKKTPWLCLFIWAWPTKPIHSPRRRADYCPLCLFGGLWSDPNGLGLI